MASYLSPYLFSPSLRPHLSNPTCVHSPGAKLSAQAPLSLSRNTPGDAPHFRRVARTCACGAGSDVLPHQRLSHRDLWLCFSSWLVIVVLFFCDCCCAVVEWEWRCLLSSLFLHEMPSLLCPEFFFNFIFGLKSNLSFSTSESACFSQWEMGQQSISLVQSQ